jgi:hypothetical protein
MLSGFFLVEMSIDRLIAVRFPMSAPRLCTRSRAIKTVIVTTVLVVIFNLQLPFVLDYVKDPVSGKELRFSSQHYTRIADWADLQPTIKEETRY